MKGIGLLTKVLVAMVVFSALSTAYFGFYQAVGEVYGKTSRATGISDATSEVMEIGENITARLGEMGEKNPALQLIDLGAIGLDIINLIVRTPNIVMGGAEDMFNSVTSVGITVPDWFRTMIMTSIVIVIVLFMAGIILKRDI